MGFYKVLVPIVQFLLHIWASSRRKMVSRILHLILGIGFHGLGFLDRFVA
jgi:hypothetical protein